MTKLSVAMIVARFPNLVQTYIVSMIAGIRNAGSAVSVIASRSAEDGTSELVSLPAEGRPDKLHYIDTDSAGMIRSLLTLPLLSARYRHLAGSLVRSGAREKYGLKYLLKALIRCRCAVHDEFDILHAHNLTHAYNYLFLKDILPCALVVTFHGLEPRGSRTLSAEKRQLLYAGSDAFLVNTQYAKRVLEGTGCPGDRIRILPQATRVATFPMQASTPSRDAPANILTVGRLSEEKGQHIALRAIAKAVRQHPNIHYHLVGDGPERDRLGTLIEELGLQQFVTMHGYASSSELAAIYADAHIFILPSLDLDDGLHVETQGVVLQEAQASGLAVIASNTGGIPEVVRNNETGLLFESGNADELADRLLTLLDDPVMYTGLVQRGRRDVEENFDVGAITARLLEIYRDVSALR